MSNTYIWIQDPLVCNIICEYILTAKFPYLIGLDTESAQPEAYAGLKSRPPFDLLQLTFNGSLEINGLHQVGQLPNLPRCEAVMTGTSSSTSFPDIDAMPSSTMLISIGTFWKSWYAASGKKEQSNNHHTDSYSSLLTVLTRTGHATTTTAPKSRSNEGSKDSSNERFVGSFSDYLSRKVPHLMRLLKDCHIVKVGCDIGGDLRDFESLIDTKLPATLDVQTLAKSLSLPKYSLNSLSERYLGRQKFNVRVISDWSQSKLDPELMHYAAGDSILTLRVCQAMMGSLPRFNDPGVTILPRSNDPGVTTLPKSDDTGVKTLPRSNAPGVKTLPRSNDPGVTTLPRSNDPGVKTLPKSNDPGVTILPRSDDAGVKTLPRSDDAGVKTLPLAEEMCVKKVKKKGKKNGKGKGKGKETETDVFYSHLPSPSSLSSAASSSPPLYPSSSSSSSLSSAASSSPLLYPSSSSSSSSSFSRSSSPSLTTLYQGNKVSTKITPSEVYQIYDFLSSNNLFTGRKQSLHISKVIQVLSNTYGAWVNIYSKSERINQANRSLELMIKDGLCVKDPVLQTICLKHLMKSTPGNRPSSGKITDKKSKSTAHMLTKTYEKNILEHLRGIFPKATLPEKLANVMANRYCSRYPDEDRIAYWMLYYMYQTENVLLTPSGNALVL